jgi:hypothetical protein
MKYFTRDAFGMVFLATALTLLEVPNVPWYQWLPASFLLVLTTICWNQ